MSFYTEEELEFLIDNDEISAEEEWWMLGYIKG